MKPAQYKAAKRTLGWTHSQIAETLGIGWRTSYRYQSEGGIPEPSARLLRLLVLLRLTVNERKFDEIVTQVNHD